MNGYRNRCHGLRFNQQKLSHNHHPLSSKFILHGCVVPEKLLTNIPELIPPEAQKVSV